MSAKKKEVKVMCGSCYYDFSPNDITVASITINPNGTGSLYCRNLCSKCLEDPFYNGRIKKSENHRKFN